MGLPAVVQDETPRAERSTRGPVRPEKLDFQTVFDGHVGFVARTLRHLGVGESDLEDVCQDVFVTVHNKLPEFEGRSSLSTWIYRIAWNTASNHRRRQATRRRRSEPLTEEPMVGAPQERALERRQNRERLAALLGALDDKRRDVFVLYEIEQLPMREVAEIVECPLQTAYSRLKAARGALIEAAEAAGWKAKADD